MISSVLIFDELRVAALAQVTAEFGRVPPVDLAWRSRLFIMVWTVYGDWRYALYAALADEPAYTSGVRRLVLSTPDTDIKACFEDAWAERGVW